MTVLSPNEIECPRCDEPIARDREECPECGTGVGR